MTNPTTVVGSQPDLDLDLMVDVFARIEHDPESWEQRQWGIRRTDCQTAYCFAGHAVLATGRSIGWEDIRGMITAEVSVCAPHLRNATHAASTVLGGGSIMDAARAALGISAPAAVRLFYGENTLDDLYEIGAEFANVEPEVLRDKVFDRV